MAADARTERVISALRRRRRDALSPATEARLAHRAGRYSAAIRKANEAVDVLDSARRLSEGEETGASEAVMKRVCADPRYAVERGRILADAERMRDLAERAWTELTAGPEGG